VKPYNINIIIILHSSALRHFESDALNVVFVRFRVRVANTTFNNTTVISWRLVLLMEAETGIHGENHRPVASH
jgi:hypothetical protein